MDGFAFAFHAKSGAQQRYMQDRVAELAEARRHRNFIHDNNSTGEPLERTTSSTSAAMLSKSTQHSRANSYGDMPPPPSSSHSSHSETAYQNLLGQPYELRHDRKYLRQLPYPLPVDLQELQRQNLRTLLSCKIFNTAVCSPHVKDDVPQRVLEIGCGSGYWSAMCHDYFSSLGYPNVSFTGLDIAPLAPDLSRQGVNWSFIQHDLRRTPLPFDNERFDLVMLKDTSLILPLGGPSQKLIEESIRILQPGGTLEIWESDHVVRSILPHPSILSRQHIDQKKAIETATFLITPATPFAPTPNRYLQESNDWIQEALDRRKLPSSPCAGISDILNKEAELENFGSRRIAIPFGELRWERDASEHSQYANGKLDSRGSRDKVAENKGLSVDQAALRHTALLTVIQMIESLEPLLKEVNGKNAEEWAGWWAAMMNQLMDPVRSTLGGECLELGAWWATKIDR